MSKFFSKSRRQQITRFCYSYAKSVKMYITRRLSEYRRNPSELAQPPPEGPNSGILVIHDQESRILSKCCFVSCVFIETYLSGLPLPQNLKLAVSFNPGGDDCTRAQLCSFLFLISLYLLTVTTLSKDVESIQGMNLNSKSGKLDSFFLHIHEIFCLHCREASASAKEENIASCCFFSSYIPEAKSKQLDPYDIYQQFEIHQKKPSSRYYQATAVAPDGVPPWLLKRKEWMVEYSKSQDFELRDDAKGVNTELRSKLPGLGTSVVVGKWYVPFMFVKERDAKDHINRSMYYSMTLEQRWVEVFSCEKDKSENSDVVVDVAIETEIVKFEGQEFVRGVENNGFVWFEVGVKKIGLGSVVVERMKWEEERFGWTSKGKQEPANKRLEKSKDGGFWSRYHCYALIESFVLKRMDGSLVLTYEFTHGDKLKIIWD